MRESGNVDIVRRCWEAWQAGRPFAAAELFHPDAVIRTAVRGWEPVVGLREADALMDDLAAQGVSVRSEAERWEDLGDYVVVHGHTTVARGDLVERQDAWFVYYLRDGKVASVTTKLDADAAFEHVLWDRR